MSEQDSSGGRVVHCEGWFEQGGVREPMEPLRLAFRDGTIQGQGLDRVGRFRFSGTLANDGKVAMIKQYLGQHQVDYLGAYDGEGVLHGEWRIGDWSSGAWWIRLGAMETDSDAEIPEYRPL